MTPTHLWASALLALATLSLPSCGDVRGHNDRHHASAIPQESFPALTARLDDLAAANPERFTVTRYGTSVEGRPLLLTALGDSRPSDTPRPAIVLTQVVHGDEYLGIVDRLPAELLRAPSAYPNVTALLARGGLVFFLPVVNPDGFEARRRGNANGADLNRDFEVRRYAARLREAQLGLAQYSDEQLAILTAYVAAPKNTQPESTALAEGLTRALHDANAHAKLFIDYHCCQDDDRGSLLHEWGDTSTLRDGTLPAVDVDRYERAARLFSWQFPRGIFGSGLETLGYMTFGTVDEWFYESFTHDGALAFTYEGQGHREDRQLDRHARLLDALAGEPELQGP